MKTKTKKIIIITSVVLAVIIGLGVVFAFINLGGVRQYNDFDRAFILVGGNRAVAISAEENEVFDTELRDALGRTRFSLLHGIFEFGLGSRVTVADEDQDVNATQRVNQLRASGGVYGESMMLELQFNRAEWTYNQGRKEYANGTRYIMVDGERQYFDSMIIIVTDSASEIIRIDAYVFLRERLTLVTDTGYSPLHYYIRPIRLRAVTTRLYNTLSDIESRAEGNTVAL
ncbi:MAG: hypothetical protein FWC80_06160 [Firmicutes bacterium]|nr:hypothetical protein [Bacillota bacterium]